MFALKEKMHKQRYSLYKVTLFNIILSTATHMVKMYWLQQQPLGYSSTNSGTNGGVVNSFDYVCTCKKTLSKKHPPKTLEEG